PPQREPGAQRRRSRGDRATEAVAVAGGHPPARPLRGRRRPAGVAGRARVGLTALSHAHGPRPPRPLAGEGLEGDGAGLRLRGALPPVPRPTGSSGPWRGRREAARRPRPPARSAPPDRYAPAGVAGRG